MTKLQNKKYKKVNINIITEKQDVIKDKLLAITRNIKNWAESGEYERINNK